MGYAKYLDDIMEDKLLNLHTAYIGKVLSYNDGKATVQPLGMVKQYGKSAERYAVVSNIPVVQSAQNKIITVVRTCGTGTTGGDSCRLITESRTHLELVPLAAGDLVFCVCADRDITEAKNGNLATPSIGHHNLSDSVVVGIL